MPNESLGLGYFTSRIRFAKSGFSMWLTLFILTPPVSVIDLYFLAFAKRSGLANGNIQGQITDGH